MSGHGHFRVYSMGLCYASVCTSLSDDDVLERMNELHPVDLELGWTISSDKTFRDGTPHPAPCPDTPGHRHILLEY